MRCLTLSFGLLLLALTACRQELITEPEKPLPAIDNQLQVLTALAANDMERAMAALAAAVDAGETPLDPATLHGTFSGLRPLPEGDAVWEASVREALPLLEAGEHQKGQVRLFKVISNAHETRVDPYLYTSLSQMQQSPAKTGLGAAMKAVDNAGGACLICELALAVGYDRDGRAEDARSQYANLGEHVDELPIIHYYLALEAQRSGDAEAAQAHLAALPWPPRLP